MDETKDMRNSDGDCVITCEPCDHLCDDCRDCARYEEVFPNNK